MPGMSAPSSLPDRFGPDNEKAPAQCKGFLRPKSIPQRRTVRIVSRADGHQHHGQRPPGPTDGPAGPRIRSKLCGVLCEPRTALHPELTRDTTGEVSG